MTPTHPIPWRLAQATAVVVLLALTGAFVAGRRDVLSIFWAVVVPLLPAVFLAVPMLWRNLCPLATLNHLTGDRVGTTVPAARMSRTLEWLGIGLLFGLVPLRHLLLNTIPLAMVVLIVVIGALTLVAGMVWPVRAGFCNGLCPVRPVETLYGQRPFATLPRARCQPCTLCVERGCLDLWEGKAVAQLLGQDRRTLAWLTQPFGVFTIAFPGLVLGYFLTADGDPWVTVYGMTLGLAAGSAILLGSLVALTRLPRRTTTMVLGALAFGLYYWFAAPAFAEAVHLPGGPWPVRGTAAILLLGWVRPHGE